MKATATEEDLPRSDDGLGNGNNDLRYTSTRDKINIEDLHSSTNEGLNIEYVVDIIVCVSRKRQK